MNGNFIKTYRKFTEWEWYKDSTTKSIFIHLLLIANWKDNKWQGIDIKRGQLITGLLSLSSDLAIPKSTIDRHLKRLVKSGEITQETGNRFRVITICNYDEYQTQESEGEKQTVIKRETSGKQVGTLEEGKEVKKETTTVELEAQPHVPYKKIVSFLNEKARKDFKHTTKSTQGLIKARFNEGFTLEDFHMVIESKVEEWQHDPDMERYIRPITIFGTKFESYLQASKENGGGKKKWG